ncbi:MAG: FMN-binding protein [Cyclobacteriaceae bacterium]
MSTDTAIAPTQTSPNKMLIAMVGIGVLCALLIVLTYEGTKPRIANLRAEALQQAIFKVVPGIERTQAFMLNKEDKFVPSGSGDAGDVMVYAGYNDKDQLQGIAIEASGQGYADIIRILYGYDYESEEIVGFYVLESKQTPGLGDNIEKDPAFLENFDGLDVALNESGDDLKNDVVTVKNGTREHDWQVDGITGATISSRAIGSIIDKSASEILPLIRDNLDVFKMDKTNVTDGN